MVEEIMPYKCRCGGILKKSQTQVEFFSTDFGIQECEVCTRCGAEFLTDEIMEKIEQKVKAKGIFGMEQQIQVTRSGNSLVLRIPPEIAKFTGLNYKGNVRMYPVSKDRLSVEIQS